MAQIVISVCRKRARGGSTNKKGEKVRYLGKKSHWTVYYLSNEGLFGTKRISLASVGYHKARVQRFLMYLCRDCRIKYRSSKKECPQCLEPGIRLRKRG